MNHKAARRGHVSKPGAGRGSDLAPMSWALWDWASQPYFTLVTTFIFFPYFATGFIGDPVRGQELLGYALGVAGLLIAVTSPVAGAVADALGRRKPWLAAFSVIFVVCSAGLWAAEPGAPNGVAFIMVMIVLASFSIESAIVFYNAMLPGLVPEARLGRLSGMGWGMGYLGGLVSLALVLWAFSLPSQMTSVFLPEAPLLGMDPLRSEADRAVGPFAAIWYIIFAIPLFLFVPDEAPRKVTMRQAIGAGLAKLYRTLVDLRNYGNVAMFLLARMIYNNGFSAIFVFGGVYARGIFGWGLTMMALFGIILTVFSALSAFIGGWFDDRYGSKPILMVSLSLLILGTLGIASVSPDGVLFVVVLEPLEAVRPAFSSVQEQVYLASGIVIGIAAGPAQAVSRTLMARLAPPGMVTEFFGLYAFSGKAVGFLAPTTVALVTAAWGSQRAGIFAILAFLICGLVLLVPVRQERAKAI